jgi:hypothetical protein
MIRQLVDQVGDASALLNADVLDLDLYVAQVWDAFSPPAPEPRAGPSARQALWSMGAFVRYPPSASPAWEHLGYSFALESSRMVQIFDRVVHEYTIGERLGIPGHATQRWLDTMQALLHPGRGAGAWPNDTMSRRATESVRRNAYWRLFGMELSFGTDRNEVFDYEKAEASNTNFVPQFEAMLRAIRRATARTGRPQLGSQRLHASVLTCVSELRNVLIERRQSNFLAREELAAATVMGWLELSLRVDSPVVKDLRVEADSAATRLALIGDRIGLPAHQKSEALFALAPDFSLLLRAIESDALLESALPLLQAGSPLADASQRVIVNWSAAIGATL